MNKLSGNEVWQSKVPWHICSDCWPLSLTEEFWEWHTYNYKKCKGCPELDYQDR